jgi:hypothetical protein
MGNFTKRTRFGVRSDSGEVGANSGSGDGDFAKRTQCGGTSCGGGEVCAKSGGGADDFAKRTGLGGSFGVGRKPSRRGSQ